MSVKHETNATSGVHRMSCAYVPCTSCIEAMRIMQVPYEIICMEGNRNSDWTVFAHSLMPNLRYLVAIWVHVGTNVGISHGSIFGIIGIIKWGQSGITQDHFVGNQGDPKARLGDNLLRIC